VKCPRCGLVFSENGEEPIGLEEARSWLRERGFPIWSGDRISARAAAEFLGKNIRTIHNYHSLGFLRAVRGGGHSQGKI